MKAMHLLKSKQKTYGKERADVKWPIYQSFGEIIVGKFSSVDLTDAYYKKVVLREVKKLAQKPDVIYAHFLRSALPVMDYAAEKNIPLILASGESTYDQWERKPEPIKRKMMETVSKVVCVSKENKNQLIDLGFKTEKIKVIPNAVDYERFRPLVKTECKEKLGIKPEKFVVGFIGHFVHRKGPNRIIEAIEKLKDTEIELICVGSGGKLKSSPFTRVIAPLPNEQLPQIYNAFDVFVLPTLHEGHCNVIEEAKACAIPIISSAGTSVEEQIDETTGILVDPLSIDAIASAIKKLKEDKKLRENMHRALLEKRDENSLQERARKIERILKNKK